MTRASRRILLAMAAAVSLTLLAGCSSTATPATTRTITATAPSTSATPSSPPAPQTPAAATAAGPDNAATTSPVSGAAEVDPNAPAGQCEDSALQVSVQYDPEAAGAGQRGAFVVFRNTGSSSCHLEGTPGLSLVGRGDGTQIGKPAERSTTGAELVTIKPDGTALAQVQYTYVDKHGGNYSDGDGHDPACKAEPVDGYRVYPPHSYRAFFTALKSYACSTALHWISVSPVRPASDFEYFTPMP